MSQIIILLSLSLFLRAQAAQGPYFRSCAKVCKARAGALKVPVERGTYSRPLHPWHLSSALYRLIGFFVFIATMLRFYFSSMCSHLALNDWIHLGPIRTRKSVCFHGRKKLHEDSWGYAEGGSMRHPCCAVIGSPLCSDFASFRPRPKGWALRGLSAHPEKKIHNF